MKNPLVLVLAALTAITLGSCKTPLDESDVPVEEWTVTKVTFYKNLLPNPYLIIKFSGPDNIAEYSYYYDFSLNDHFSFTQVISIPNVTITGTEKGLYDFNG